MNKYQITRLITYTIEADSMQEAERMAEYDLSQQGEIDKDNGINWDDCDLVVEEPIEGHKTIVTCTDCEVCN